jgi:hypothetical protein
MTYLLATIGLAFIFLMLAAFYFFDRLVKVQYADFKDEWEKNGSPHGFFWLPKESASKVKVTPKPSSTRARTKHLFSWVFRTPEWIKQDQQAKSDIFKLRSLLVISLTLLVSFGILYFVR